MSGRDSGLQNPEAASGFSDLSDSEFLQIEEPKIGELLSGPRPQPVDSRRANVEERKRRRAKRKRPRRTPLEAFHLRYLCVTDLSAQVWCEQQTVYHKEKPSVQLPEKTTVVLNTGKSIHLARGQRVRECPVFGVLEGIFVFGIIDQLNYTAKGELQLNELKTREKAYMPVPGQKKRDRFQVSLYKHLFDAMVQGCLTQDIFIHHLRLKPKQSLGQEIQEHAQKAGFVVQFFEDLLELVLLNLTHSDIPAIDRLQIEYIHQETNTLLGTEVITYDHDELMSMSHYFLAYWKGQRDPKGVDIEDTWKCIYCVFVDICDWRRQRADSLIQKGSEKKT
ncbi:exonuclease V isoform X2 [Ahaetulla prasina]|uniref:exonuclease V isoform X2 n=1 Tax=Ahaetulla prasina TaxID=499056 RepID=UPI002648B4CB|nr:exonuclease V isoform X2 [Ahaetulla prasina]